LYHIFISRVKIANSWGKQEVARSRSQRWWGEGFPF